MLSSNLDRWFYIQNFVQYHGLQSWVGMLFSLTLLSRLARFSLLSIRIWRFGGLSVFVV